MAVVSASPEITESPGSMASLSPSPDHSPSDLSSPSPSKRDFQVFNSHISYQFHFLWFKFCIEIDCQVIYIYNCMCPLVWSSVVPTFALYLFVSRCWVLVCLRKTEMQLVNFAILNLNCVYIIIFVAVFSFLFVLGRT